MYIQFLCGVASVLIGETFALRVATVLIKKIARKENIWNFLYFKK